MAKSTYIITLFLCCLAFALAMPHLHAQRSNIGTPIINNFYKNDYHGGPQNWGCAQAPSGLAYFANNDGLLEYDGQSWRKYSLPSRTNMRAVACDSLSGRVYIGGQNELGYFAPDVRGALQYHSLLGLIPPARRSFDDVWNVVPHTDGVFFRSATQVCRLVSADSMAVYHWQGLVQFIGQAQGALFVQIERQGLWRWNGQDFVPLLPASAFNYDLVTGVVALADSSLVFGTLVNGLFRQKGEQCAPWLLADTPWLRQNRIHCMAQHGQLLALGTNFGGLALMDAEGRLINVIDKGKGLQNNSVLGLGFTRSGQLWLGLDNGLAFVETNTPYTWVIPDAGLEGIGYAATIHKGHLYLGTANGLYMAPWQHYYSPFQPNPFRLVAGTSGQVWRLDHVGGRLLLGHHEGAFDVEGGQATRIGPIGGAWLFQVAKRDSSVMLAGTYTGLAVFRKDAQGRWQFERVLEGFEESSRIMAQDERGHIWITHPYRGIYRLRLSADYSRIEQLRYFNGDNGFPSDFHFHVFEVDGELVFVGEKGLYSFLPDEERFVPHQTLGQFFAEGERFNRLLEDSEGHIWYNSSSGTGYLQVKDKGLRRQIAKQSLSDLPTGLVGGFELLFPYDARHVFFNTDKGFLHYDPSALRADSLPTPLLRHVRLGPAYDSLLFEGLWPPARSELALPHHLNALQFSFASPHFGHRGQLRYRTRLQGLEKDWSAWSDNTTKEFTNLPPGDYVFMVQAALGEGLLSAESRFPFRVRPPWYASPWAYSAYAVAAVAMLLGLVMVPQKRYEKEKAQLQRQQADTLRQKEAEHRQDVAQKEHEIVQLRHDKLRAEVEYKNSELASMTMHLVQKNEMLLKLREELDKLRKMGDAQKVRQEIQRIERLLEDDSRMDEDWERFALYFDEVHGNFLKRLAEQFPQLTPKDQKLCAYLRMNLSTKDIAPLLHISVRGVEISRYRLRKKLGLDTDTNLNEFMMRF